MYYQELIIGEVLVLYIHMSQFVIEFYAKLRFSQTKYSFKENSGSAKITLVLSKPLSSGFDITMISAALTPTLTNKGEHIIMYIRKYLLYDWYYMPLV